MGRKRLKFCVAAQRTGLQTVPIQAVLHSTAQISIQAKDAIGRTWRVSTIQFLTSTSRTVSDSSTQLLTEKTGYDPLGEVWFDWAFHPVLTQALCRCFPRMALSVQVRLVPVPGLR